MGLDQFPVPHARGSHHGETRVIRKAYFEHPDYVPLLERSYELWNELEEVSGEEIFNRCGLVIYADDEKSSVYQGTLTSSKSYNIPIEELDANEANKRWPAYYSPGHFSAIYEPDAGFLYPEKAIRNYISLARMAGASIRENQKVLGIQSGTVGITVKTKDMEYHAKKLVITAGSWIGSFLGVLNFPFRLLRKILTWHPAGNDHHVQSTIPCAVFDTGDHLFYTFPMIDESTIKIGKHSGGDPVSDPANKEVDTPPSSYVDPLKNMIDSHLPHITPEYSRFITCLYTNTPDQHFLIDRHPGDSNIVFAAGFSGHGFKFSSVIGEILADLLSDSRSPLLTDFLKLRTFPES